MKRKGLYIALTITFLFAFAGCKKKTTTKTKTTNVTKVNPTSITKKTTEETKYIVSFDSNGGSNVNSQEVKKGGYASKPADPTKDNYTFVGWYNGETLWDFTSSKVEDKMTLKAKWTINNYSIALNNEVDGLIITGTSSDGLYEYGSSVTLTASNIPSGYTIKWSLSNNENYFGNECSFTVSGSDINVTVSARPYVRDGKKVYFGTYPQTEVEATTENGLLSIEFDDTWTSYKYYFLSQIKDYMFYKDVDVDDDGIFDYRGVYFNQYRPYNALNNVDEGNYEYTYQINNGYEINKIYWFSYDPIEWNIFSESDGKALLIANLLLDSQIYYPSKSTASFEHNDGTGHTNNYALSEIRKWLNDNFYNTAFNDLQKELIQITEVDNSTASTPFSTNNYVCENTFDKIFILSYSEQDKYFPSPDSKLASCTDYAKVQGIYGKNNAYWWMLRTPVNDGAGYSILYMTNEGYATTHYACLTCGGVRPALWIEL